MDLKWFLIGFLRKVYESPKLLATPWPQTKNDTNYHMNAICSCIGFISQISYWLTTQDACMYQVAPSVIYD